MAKPLRINVSLVGGQHQFLHILPVAAWLSRQHGVTVGLFPRNGADAADADLIMRGLGAGPYATVVMQQRLAVRAWRAVAGRKGAKVAELLGSHWIMRTADALLVAERTSALLTRLPGPQPLYIRFTHGVGDREKGFDPKARAFDHFVVAGEKYAARFAAEAIAPPDRIWISGYIKLPALRQIKAGRARRLFADQRPVVLYNAHFDETVGSWSLAGRAVVETILRDGRYNLIVAPHMRLFAHASDQERARWEAYGRASNCIVDLGSHASTDMTYVDAADIYLGDVSSQVYEFVAEPRPCIFLNSHGIAWESDESYRMWRLGQVIGDPARELIAALDASGPAHASYRRLQQQETRAALGDMSGDPAQRAGEIVLSLLRRSPRFSAWASAPSALSQPRYR